MNIKQGSYFLVICSALFTMACSAKQESTGATTKADGLIQKSEGRWQAWDGEKQAWVSVEQFWLNYAERNGGLTWGRGKHYPDYDKVNEFDTFMVEVDTGPCLMEFFHERWRRAQDVRRWDEAFNEYGGCPNVFD